MAESRKIRKQKRKMQIRRKKEFSYKGYSLNELQKMSVEEFATIAPSRIRRVINRGFVDKYAGFMKKLEGKELVKTHDRDIIIIPSMVGKKIAVYNGKEFKSLDITEEMIGHYLGEFSLTRSFSKHSGPGVGATKSSKFMPLK